MTLPIVAIGGLAITGTGCGFLSPGGHGASGNPTHSPRFVLPVQDPSQILMVSRTHGWLVTQRLHLFHTDDGGHHWAEIKTKTGFVTSYGGGRSAWTFLGSTTGKFVAKRVTDAGRIWQHTVTSPGAQHVAWAWASSPHNGVGGLAVSGINNQGQLKETIWTFDATSRSVRALYTSPALVNRAPISNITVQSPTKVWAVSNTPGPSPSFWTVTTASGSSSRTTLTRVPLTLPAALAAHHPTTSPAPIAGPEFPGHGVGYLGANYQSVSVDTSATVADALLYRDDGDTWAPIWRRSGQFLNLQFVSTQVGWIEYAPLPGTVKLLRTTDGGRAFHPVRVPGKGHPEFVTADDGWWVDVGRMAANGITPVKLWETHDGGQTWTPVKITGRGRPRAS